MVNVVPTITKGGTITGDAASGSPVVATPNADIYSAGIEFESDTVHISSPVRLSKKLHLQGSRLFNLQNLCNVIKTISQHSITCGAIVDLIGEVQRNRLASKMLATCSKCNKEFLFSSCDKVTLWYDDGKKGLHGLTMQQQ